MKHRRNQSTQRLRKQKKKENIEMKLTDGDD
jgi:hypothetical protein